MQQRSTRANIILLGVVATILTGWVLHVGAGIIQPLVIAFLLCSMLQPVVRGLKRFKIPPALTVILLVTLFFFAVARLGILLQENVRSFLGQEISVQLEDLDPFSEEQKELTEQTGGWAEIVAGLGRRMTKAQMPEPLVAYVMRALNNVDLEGVASDVIGGGFGFTKNLLLVVLYMLFIFAEQAVFRRKIMSVSGDRKHDAEGVLDTIGRGIQRYLGVKTIVSITTGALCYAGLIFLDVPWALLFGLITFLLNYIPTFGSIIAGGFPMLTALAVESSWNKAVWVLVLYVSVNQILGAYIEPKILGRELNLSPLVIIVSVVVWAGLWGIVGAFLAVPLTAGIQIILASQERTRPIAVLLSSGPPRDDKRRGPQKPELRNAS